jgi:hypothetical protein
MHSFSKFGRRIGMQLDKDLITEAAAAKRLGRKPKTLATWRARRKGPPFHKVGGTVFYDVADLRAFVRSHRVDPQRPLTETEAPPPAESGAS